MSKNDLRQYQVQHDYASSIGGPWDKGQLLWLPVEDAAALNRDSPGVVKLIAPELYDDPVLGTADVTGTPAVPARNRQVRQAPARKQAAKQAAPPRKAVRHDRAGSAGDQGAITAATFKATKKG